MRPIILRFDTSFINASKTEAELAATQAFVAFQTKPSANTSVDTIQRNKNTLQNVNEYINAILHSKTNNLNLMGPYLMQMTTKLNEVTVQAIGVFLNKKTLMKVAQRISLY